MLRSEAEADVQAAASGQAEADLPLHLLMLLQGVVGFSMASLPCHEFGEIWAS